MESPFHSPLVVGYKGEIGRFLLDGLLQALPKANEIYCVDVSNTHEEVAERIARADVVFLAVPLQSTSDWLFEFLDELKGKVVCEQCSLKSFLFEEPALEGVDFLSMHLLFRPSATAPGDRRGLIFSDSRSQDELEAVALLFSQWFGTPITVLGREVAIASHVLHDRMMAREQALVHRVLLALAERLGDPDCRTYVGQRVVELAARIRAGYPTLNQIIQSNSHLAPQLDAFVEGLRERRP